MTSVQGIILQQQSSVHSDLECPFCRLPCVLFKVQVNMLRWNGIRAPSVMQVSLCTLFEEYASLEGLIHRPKCMTVSRAQRFTQREEEHYALLYSLLWSIKTFARKAVELSSLPPLFIFFSLPQRSNSLKVLFTNLCLLREEYESESKSCVKNSKMWLLAQQSIYFSSLTGLWSSQFGYKR